MELTYWNRRLNLHFSSDGAFQFIDCLVVLLSLVSPRNSLAASSQFDRVRGSWLGNRQVRLDRITPRWTFRCRKKRILFRGCDGKALGLSCRQGLTRNCANLTHVQLHMWLGRGQASWGPSQRAQLCDYFLLRMPLRIGLRNFPRRGAMHWDVFCNVGMSSYV